LANVKKNGFAIVGIGASAGGLEAFEQFFTNMPTDSGMSRKNRPR
jgi:two-component system CheB/CheR fusion protein